MGNSNIKLEDKQTTRRRYMQVTDIRYEKDERERLMVE